MPPPFVSLVKHALELVYQSGIDRVLDHEQSPDEISGRFLADQQVFEFSITQTGIEYHPTALNRKDGWLVGFLGQGAGMTLALKADTDAYWQGFLISSRDSTRHDRKAQNSCTGRGYPCGNTCISREKTCRVSSAEVKSAAQTLLRWTWSSVTTTPPASTHDPNPATSQPPDPKQVAQKILEAEEAIRDRRTEKVLVFDEYGDVVFEKEGDESSIGFTAKELRRFKGRVVTHNHPSRFQIYGTGTKEGGSFSLEDIQCACIAEAKEIRAVATEGTYSIKPPTNGFSFRFWEEKTFPAYQKHLAQAHRELLPEVTSGRIDAFTAQLEMYDRVHKRVAQGTGMTYRFERKR